MSTPDLSHRPRCDPEPGSRRPLPALAFTTLTSAQASGPPTTTTTTRPITVHSRRPSALKKTAAPAVEGSDWVVSLAGGRSAPWGVPADPLLLAGRRMVTAARHAGLGRGPSLASCIDLIRSANDVSATAASDVGARGSGEGAGGGGKGISFALGTACCHRPGGRGGRSASVRKVSSTFNLRPITREEERPLRKFQLPKATLPSMHYLSVSHEDFLDPRYAASIMKNYTVPKYFFKSKSNLLVDLPHLGESRVAKTSFETVSEEREHPPSAAAEAELDKEVEDVRPKTSNALWGPSDLVPRARLQPATFDPSMRHTGLPGMEGSGQVTVGAAQQVPGGSKSLLGGMRSQRRCCPALNALRSLPLDSEVNQYVQHKKRVGLGRFVRFVEDSPLSASAAKLREASMYDLKNPLEGPADQYLSPAGTQPSGQGLRNLAASLAHSSVNG